MPVVSHASLSCSPTGTLPSALASPGSQACLAPFRLATRGRPDASHPHEFSPSGKGPWQCLLPRPLTALGSGCAGSLQQPGRHRLPAETGPLSDRDQQAATGSGTPQGGGKGVVSHTPAASLVLGPWVLALCVPVLSVSHRREPGLVWVHLPGPQVLPCAKSFALASFLPPPGTQELAVSF